MQTNDLTSRGAGNGANSTHKESSRNSQDGNAATAASNLTPGMGNAVSSGTSNDVVESQPRADEHGQLNAVDSDQECTNTDGTKTAELWLHYMEPIEDFHHCLNDSPTDLDALTALANNMDWTGNILRAVKDAIAGHEAQVWTEPDAILVRGPAAVIDELISNGNLQKWPRTEEAKYSSVNDSAHTTEHDQHDADGMKMAEFDRRYFEQVDLQYCLEETGNLLDALALHASFMDDSARELRFVELVLANGNVSIEFRSTCVLVSGPATVIDDLLLMGALKVSE